MNKFIHLSLILTAIMLFSCENGYKYWDISKFRIDNVALEDNEEIKLFYSSRGPDSNEDLEYYIHLIVISQKTGDTVNVLTTADNGFTKEDKDKVFNYFNQDSFATKVSQIGVDNLENIKDIEDINNIPAKDIKKVARDPKFDYLADNNYPTVIGSIGTMAKNQQ